jgi:hypothetical protein
MSHQLWSVLIKKDVSPNLVYYLDCCRNKIKPNAIINVNAESIVAKSKGFMDESNNLTDKAVELLDDFETFLVKTKKKVTSDVLGDDFSTKIDEYKNIFPAGLLPSKQPARQTKQELKDKFIWFFKTYPEFDWTTVLDATDYYVHEYAQKPKPYEFMATSSYFIKKTDKVGLVTSHLASYCQMIKDNPTVLYKRIDV